jgi:hypothetical protein
MDDAGAGSFLRGFKKPSKVFAWATYVNAKAAKPEWRPHVNYEPIPMGGLSPFGR